MSAKDDKIFNFFKKPVTAMIKHIFGQKYIGKLDLALEFNTVII
ncbi:hypothetical protein LRP_1708 [Ligilactobacillus ruminis]|nr:hypothetical protein LRP_1708 [Ligilactobacillus ruminis]